MHIRTPTAADLPLLGKLRERLVDYAPRWWDKREALAGMNAVVAAAVADRRASDFLAVADVEGSPAGFLYAVTRKDPLMQHSYAFVLEFVAANDGRGVGRALLEAAEVWAAEGGLARVSLAVFATNPARGFYEHLGFETDALLMSKALRTRTAG